MALNLGNVLAAEDLASPNTLVIRHAYVVAHADGTSGIHADSTDDEILEYTSAQDVGRFPKTPADHWLVFLPESGSRARFWAVIRNHGEVSNNGTIRTFHLERTDLLREYVGRLVIGWAAPLAWYVHGATASTYPVHELADATAPRFPGFENLELDYPVLQAVIRDRRYEAWRSALASVAGIYVITDLRDGRNYVGKADGAENVLQRWSAYASNGHGGNVELQGLDPTSFRFSLLRVFDPTTPQPVINRAESHYKRALDSVRHGLNGG